MRIEFTPNQGRPWLEKLADPAYLPTLNEIRNIFEEPRPRRKRWEKFFYGTPAADKFYELLNQEYVNALADYIIERIQQYAPDKVRPVTILEVGAGNGRLAHFLRQKLAERFPGKIQIIATDSGEDGIIPLFPVEQLTYQEALQKYQPTIVITSWMPLGIDWTEGFRQTSSVQEYILIGETKKGACGHPWKTWGVSNHPEQKTPPYEKDGFEKISLPEFTGLQICWTDYPRHYYNSKTVSFRRL